ncbi:E3 ubiquitin-protein ligase [Teratosphaeria destructans]|uniref:E3 ubiquitin-protein ligase n=1 Tax=Teratosphaeria destructans TaxID=418781 RepID=A0A9W7SR59_9PEZI|nr:E3 ubiquitin-protein ligase [Teratosphaeria destructans]
MLKRLLSKRQQKQEAPVGSATVAAAHALLSQHGPFQPNSPEDVMAKLKAPEFLPWGDCVICKRDFDFKNDLVQLWCGHSFCRHCMVTYLASGHKKCPESHCGSIWFHTHDELCRIEKEEKEKGR